MKRIFEEIKKYKLLFVVLLSLYLLNLHDMAWTYYFVTGGYAEEINPVMKYLLDVEPISFLFVKIVLMGWVVLALWRRRHSRMTYFAAFFSLGIYSLIFIYQITIIFYFFFL